MSEYFAYAVYLVLFAVSYAFRRRIVPYQHTATFQRSRWRKLAKAHGLVATGAPGEFTGTWNDVTVVLGTHFAPAKQLLLELRALGLMQPATIADALCTEVRFADWHHEVVDGELRVHVPFRGSSLDADDLDAWLAVVHQSAQRQGSAYRD